MISTIPARNNGLSGRYLNIHSGDYCDKRNYNGWWILEYIIKIEIIQIGTQW